MVKYKKSILAFTLAFVLATSTFMQAEIKSQAVVFEALTSYEVAKILLYSVGIGLAGYGAYKTLEMNEQDAAFDGLKQSWNSFKSGFGDYMEHLITGQELHSGDSISLSQEDFSTLKEWGASSPTLTVKEDSISVDSYLSVTNFLSSITGSSFVSSTNSYMTKFINDHPNGTYGALQCFDTESGINLFVFRNSGGDVNLKYSISPFNYYQCSVYGDDTSCIVIRYNLQNNQWKYISSFNVSINSYYGYGTFYLKDSTYPSCYIYVEPTILLNNSNGFMVTSQKVNSNFLTVSNSNYSVVTPGMSLNDGQLTGDIKITLPETVTLAQAETLLREAETETEKDDIIIADILPLLNVYPVNTDTGTQILPGGASGKPISDVIDEANDEQSGGTGSGAVVVVGDDYQLSDSIIGKFPFCIPFDFAKFIGLLVADPEAPNFDFKIPKGYVNGQIAWTEFHISLDIFDGVAVWLRRFELLAFIIGLIMITRNQFIRN